MERKTLLVCNEHILDNRVREVDFLIVDTESVLILGLESCVELEFIKLAIAIESPRTTTPTSPTRKHVDNKSVLSECKDVFESIGLVSGECEIA